MVKEESNPKGCSLFAGIESIFVDSESVIHLSFSKSKKEAL
jgi:hypothetical protein